MWHDVTLESSFLQSLSQIDEAIGRQVRETGCPHCGGPLDRADYPRKPRGDLGEACAQYGKRVSLCCRREGCRRRATPPSVRFLGRKVYVAALVVVASMVGRAIRLCGRGAPREVKGVPVRTVRRWLDWWRVVVAQGAFWVEAKGIFATPVAEAELPASLLAHFGTVANTALERTLRFLAPMTSTSVRARITMAM